LRRSRQSAAKSRQAPLSGAVERELARVGYPADGIRALERPIIRVAINGACRIGRATLELRKLSS
jgi:hypothetical protein